MNRKYGLLCTVAIFASVLVVSSATAVPYTNSKAVGQDSELSAKLEKLVSSKPFKTLQRIAEKNLNEETKSKIRNNVNDILLKDGAYKEYPLSDTYLGEILIAIAEIILFLCGHNPIGQGIAIVVTCVLAFIGVAIIAIPLTPVIIVAEVAAAIQQIIGDTDLVTWIITNFGVLGAMILSIIAIPVILIIIVLGCIPTYIMLVINDTLSTIDEVMAGVQWQ